MATVADVAAYDALLKKRFPDFEVKRLMYAKSPFLGLVPKDEGFTGSDMKLPVIVEGAVGYSADSATALAMAAPAIARAFTLVRKSFYGATVLGNEMLLASADKEGAFHPGLQTQIQNLFYSMSLQLSYDLYGDGKGYIGFIKAGSAVNTTALNLSNVTDVRHFQKNAVVQLVDPAGGGGAGTLRSGTLTVVSVNRSTGVVTMNANINTITGAAAGDAVVVQNTFTQGRITGLRGWLVNNPSSTPFFGVARDEDPTRLAGQFIDAATLTSGSHIYNCIQEAALAVWREGGQADVVLVNPVQHKKLTDWLDGKTVLNRSPITVESLVERDSRGHSWQNTQAKFGSGEVKAGQDVTGVVPGRPGVSGPGGMLGYSTVRIASQCGELTVISDPACPASEAFVLQMDTWKLHSLGGAPRIFDKDGMILHPSTNGGDSYDFRVVWYAQLGCTAPGFNARISNLATG
jgi:hypothetical protein